MPKPAGPGREVRDARTGAQVPGLLRARGQRAAGRPRRGAAVLGEAARRHDEVVGGGRATQQRDRSRQGRGAGRRTSRRRPSVPFLAAWRQYALSPGHDAADAARGSSRAGERRRALDAELRRPAVAQPRRCCATTRSVRAALQRKYRWLLVDEFQDTDPIQAEVMLLLAADEDCGHGVAGPSDIDPYAVPPSPGRAVRRRRPEAVHLPVPAGGHRHLQPGARDHPAERRGSRAAHDLVPREAVVCASGTTRCSRELLPAKRHAHQAAFKPLDPDPDWKPQRPSGEGTRRGLRTLTVPEDVARGRRSGVGGRGARSRGSSVRRWTRKAPAGPTSSCSRGRRSSLARVRRGAAGAAGSGGGDWRRRVRRVARRQGARRPAPGAGRSGRRAGRRRRAAGTAVRHQRPAAVRAPAGRRLLRLVCRANGEVGEPGANRHRSAGPSNAWGRSCGSRARCPCRRPSNESSRTRVSSRSPRAPRVRARRRGRRAARRRPGARRRPESGGSLADAADALEQAAASSEVESVPLEPGRGERRAGDEPAQGEGSRGTSGVPRGPARRAEEVRRRAHRSGGRCRARLSRGEEGRGRAREPAGRAPGWVGRARGGRDGLRRGGRDAAAVRRGHEGPRTARGVTVGEGREGPSLGGVGRVPGRRSRTGGPSRESGPGGREGRPLGGSAGGGRGGARETP